MGFSSILKTAYPFINAAASLGGPMGTMVAGLVGKALGVDKVDPSQAGIEAAIAKAQITDPDALLKLQQAEEAFKLQMQTLGFDHAEKLLEADDADRASARAREIAVKDDTPKIMAYIVICMTIVAEGYILGHGTPVGLDGVVLGRILGTLDSALIMVLSYYFGSSAGSKVKDDTINTAITDKK